MDQTLKEHEHLIDEHDDKLSNIQQDITDIKVRLGIKDLTNGQVVDYQKRLSDDIADERKERKEQDNLLRESLKSMDDKIWFIVTGIILMVLLEIGLFVLQNHL